MTNEEIYESSLRFLFKQLDYYLKFNKVDKKSNKKHKSKSQQNNSEVITRKVVDDWDSIGF